MSPSNQHPYFSLKRKSEVDAFGYPTRKRGCLLGCSSSQPAVTVDFNPLDKARKRSREDDEVFEGDTIHSKKYKIAQTSDPGNGVIGAEVVTEENLMITGGHCHGTQEEKFNILFCGIEKVEIRNCWSSYRAGVDKSEIPNFSDWDYGGVFPVNMIFTIFLLLFDWLLQQEDDQLQTMFDSSMNLQRRSFSPAKHTCKVAAVWHSVHRFPLRCMFWCTNCRMRWVKPAVTAGQKSWTCSVSLPLGERHLLIPTGTDAVPYPHRLLFQRYCPNFESSAWKLSNIGKLFDRQIGA